MRNGGRINDGIVHQSSMMSVAEPHGKLVDDLEAQPAGQRKPQMTGVAEFSFADQAGLFGDKSQVSLVVQAPRLRNGERALLLIGPEASNATVCRGTA